MLAPNKLGTPFNNRILAALSREEYGDLRPFQEHVRLVQGRVIYDAGDLIRYVYFPLGGMLSLLSTTRAGASVEVGMIGKEGVAGLPAILRVNTAPYRVVIQLPGNAMRFRVDVLKDAFNRGGRLQDLLLRYMHTLLTQISQSAACNRFHTVEERLCRWLLVSHDRVNSDVLGLTQEFLSQMIGSPRTSVTAIAGALQRANLIAYSRGKLRILNRPGLEAASCECYEVVRGSIDEYLAA